jgi:magnesium-transporting ATPase (P-type)
MLDNLHFDATNYVFSNNKGIVMNDKSIMLYCQIFYVIIIISVSDIFLSRIVHYLLQSSALIVMLEIVLSSLTAIQIYISLLPHSLPLMTQVYIDMYTTRQCIVREFSEDNSKFILIKDRSSSTFWD